MLTKTETEDTKWNTSNSAPSQSQAQHTQGWQGDTGAPLPGGFLGWLVVSLEGALTHKDGRGTQELSSLVVFRLVRCFFGRDSYYNDPLPVPAVNFLGFYMTKASKTQTTC